MHEVADRLKEVAQQEGLAFGERKMTYNSRLAQELGKWAEEEGRGEPFHLAAFQAYFADGVNIARISHLVDLAVKVGLPGPEAREVLEKRRFKEAVDADWARSRDLDVVAAPTFILNGNRLVGAQPYGTLERFLNQNHVPRRSHDPLNV